MSVGPSQEPTILSKSSLILKRLQGIHVYTSSRSKNLKVWFIKYIRMYAWPFFRGLLIATLFDRDINCRRAASVCLMLLQKIAAFYEMIIHAKFLVNRLINPN